MCEEVQWWMKNGRGRAIGLGQWSVIFSDLTLLDDTKNIQPAKQPVPLVLNALFHRKKNVGELAKSHRHIVSEAVSQPPA